MHCLKHLKCLLFNVFFLLYTVYVCQIYIFMYISALGHVAQVFPLLGLLATT